MILVAGSANLDFVVRANHIPSPGETVLGRDFKTFPGGKGANQAVASARAGDVSTHMLLALGDDAFAPPIEASLADANVNLHTVRSTNEPTGTAFICVSDDAENAITVAPGANHSLRAEHLPALVGFSHILMQLETPLETVAAYAKAAKAQSVTVALNAAPAQALPAELLRNVDILILNEGELAATTQHQGSIAQCLERIDAPTVVVTLGHRGCCARHLGQIYLQPAFPVDPVDTTAAGDTFCGTLVAALSHGAAMPDALRQASAAGALACTKLGAQSSIPTAQEVATLLASSAPASAEALTELKTYCGLS
ncbi:ribokinase [Rhodoferax aquaticus]|uniref:Ribokinase n=1 Tax=Rhodoferax aquaticus TaxID=2527691 RepID=A0A515ENW6_9BURK|nr:ribokinase [Rhodoferax aquaticus]QDL54359.1 ribokinase [Rhodoferax aquaticus]